jgi:alpha-1,6-mannosyltransferase
MRAPKRPALAIALCLLGAALISWVRFALSGTLRLHDDGLGFLARNGLLLALGVCLGSAAIFQLRARVAQISLRQLLAGAVLIQLCALPALPFTSSDLFSNLAYARLEWLGQNPFFSAPRALGAPYDELVGPRWLDTPSVYGPVAQRLGAPSGSFSSVPAQLVAYKLILLGAALAFLALAFGFCTTLPDRERAETFAVAAFSPLFAWEISGQAHNEGFLLVALTAFVWAASARREWLALVCIAIATFTKLAALPVAGLYLVFIARRSPLRGAAMGLLFAAVGALLLAPYSHGLATLDAQLSALRGDSTRHWRSLIDFAWWCALPFGSGAQLLVYRLGSSLGFALLAAFGVWAIWRATTLARVLRDAATFFLLSDLLASAAFQPWYVTWLLPLALAERDSRWRRLYAVYAALSVAQYGLALDPVTYLVVNAIPLTILAKLWRERDAAEPALGVLEA